MHEGFGVGAGVDRHPGESHRAHRSDAAGSLQGDHADFNVGCAIAAVQSLPEGVFYLVMNGQVFDPHTTRKDVGWDRFVEAA